jgi:hypothetical protein
LAKLQKAANADLQVASTGANGAAATPGPAAQDANIAKAFQTLAKATAAYRAFNG